MEDYNYNEDEVNEGVVTSDSIKEINGLKKRIKRMEIINILSLIMLIVLIGMNFHIVDDSGSSVEVSREEQSFPEFINSSTIKTIGSNVQEAYNSRDMERLYNILGEYTQTLVSLDEFNDQMAGLEILGTMDKTSYSYKEFLGKKEGGDWYVLHYISKYSNGNGTMSVTLRVIEDNWEIIGFNMNVDKLENFN